MEDKTMYLFAIIGSVCIFIMTLCLIYLGENWWAIGFFISGIASYPDNNITINYEKGGS